MKGTTFLQRLKPYLLAMSLDYSVVPACTIQLITELFATGEHNVGKDASGSIAMTMTNALADVEDNVGRDNTIDLEFGAFTLDGSAENNAGHDVGAFEWLLGISMEGSAEEVAGRFAKGFRAFTEYGLQASGLNAVPHPSGEAESEAEFLPSATPMGATTHQMQVGNTTQFDFVVALQVFEEAIKKVQDATSEMVSTAEIVMEALETQQPTIDNDVVIDFESTLNRTYGRRAVMSKEIAMALAVIIEKFKWAIINDMENTSINAFFENKTMERAMLIQTT